MESDGWSLNDEEWGMKGVRWGVKGEQIWWHTYFKGFLKLMQCVCWVTQDFFIRNCISNNIVLVTVIYEEH